METQQGSKWFKGYCSTCDRNVHRPLPRRGDIPHLSSVDVRCIECETVIPCKTSDTGNPVE